MGSKGRVHRGKGKDPFTDRRTKSITMHIDKSTREFDVVNMEEELKRHQEALDAGRPGTMSVLFPRVCSSRDEELREWALGRTDDRWWGVSPWEICGKPEEDGTPTTEVIEFPWDMNHELNV